jgi:hypothetical protein
MPADFAPHLIEAVVRRHVDLNTQEIAEDYHRLYENLAEAGLHTTEERISCLHQYFFKRLGCDRIVADVAAEFPNLVLPVRVGPADGVEGCFPSPARDVIVVRLKPDRFEQPEALRRFLRHEFMHVADVLDPAFGYPQERRELEPAARERYAVLWGIHADARIARSGREPLRSRADWLLRIDPSWRPMFESFWNRERITHAELLDWAVDPAKFAGSSAGGRCSLCRFPTFVWGKLNDEVVRLIGADYPTWDPQKGACERCVESYEIRAGHW